jgi:hypothetical protein
MERGKRSPVRMDEFRVEQSIEWKQRFKYIFKRKCGNNDNT